MIDGNNNNKLKQVITFSTKKKYMYYVYDNSSNDNVLNIAIEYLAGVSYIPVTGGTVKWKHRHSSSGLPGAHINISGGGGSGNMTMTATPHL